MSDWIEKAVEEFERLQSAFDWAMSNGHDPIPQCPDLEAIIRRHLAAEETALAVKVAELERENAALRADNDSWRQKLLYLQECLDKAKAERNALRSPMPCGHPRACWQEPPLPADEGSCTPESGCDALCMEAASGGHCAACEEARELREALKWALNYVRAGEKDDEGYAEARALLEGK